MTSHYDSARLDELIRQLLDDQLDDAGIAALNSILRDSADARGHYRESVRLHAALIRHRSAGNIVPMPRALPSRRLAWTAVAENVGVSGTMEDIVARLEASPDQLQFMLST